MVEEEYPIHPTLDNLIQSFKEFKRTIFPRGMTKPVTYWKEVLKNLTHYEAYVIQVANEYLGGNIVKPDGLNPPGELAKAIGDLKIRSAEDSDYLNKLQEYQKLIEAIAYNLQDCLEELGNPCQKFRAD